MPDRCAACGAWLRPDSDCCDTCQADVKAAAPQGKDAGWETLELDVASGRPSGLGGPQIGAKSKPPPVPPAAPRARPKPPPPPPRPAARPQAPAPPAAPSLGGLGGGSLDLGGGSPDLSSGAGGGGLDLSGPGLEDMGGGLGGGQDDLAGGTWQGGDMAQDGGSLDVASLPPAPAPRAPEPDAAPAAPTTPREWAPDVPPPKRAEVLVLAGYGPAPSGVLPAIPYAIHVFTRRRELTRTLADADRLREAARDAASRAMAEFGQDVVSRAESLQLSDVRPELEAAQGAAGSKVTAPHPQETPATDFEAELQGFDAKLADARAAEGPVRDRESALRTQLGVRDQTLRRVQAMLKRSEIELRNASAPGSPPDPDRIAMLQADREARAAEVAAAEGPVRELTRELTAIRKELATRVSHVTMLEQERNRTASTVQQHQAAEQVRLGDAERRRVEVLCALARAVQEKSLAEPPPPLKTRLESTMRTWGERHRVALTHRAAIDAFDRTAVKKGAGVLGAAAAFILAMFVFVVVW